MLTRCLMQTAPVSSWCPASFPNCGTGQNNSPCSHRIQRRAQKATAPVNKGVSYLQVRGSCFCTSVLPWLTISSLLAPAPDILLPGHCLTVWTRPLKRHTRQSHALLDTSHIWHSLFPFPKKSKLFTWPLGLLDLLQSSERTKRLKSFLVGPQDHHCTKLVSNSAQEGGRGWKSRKRIRTKKETTFVVSQETTLHTSYPSWASAALQIIFFPTS